MIVRIARSGKSFKGLGKYLLHDPKATTANRVAWTHTLNLANDHAASAIDEMIQTARNADVLKQEAGLRTGGRRTQITVKHVSLNWPKGEVPTQAGMIAAAKSFLTHMGWGGHQALLVAHNDRHPHLHLMINAVHPDSGRRLEDGLEQRRAQVWALAYEQAHGDVLCANRLKKQRDRQKAPPRETWLAFEGKRRAFEQHENLRPDQEAPKLDATHEDAHAREWRLLKVFQRREREAFFTSGKAEFAALRLHVYRELRAEFRPRWRAYYAAKKTGHNSEAVRTMKTELLAQQRTTLADRRDKAYRDLRSSRDHRYRTLLKTQGDARRVLRERQAAGLDSSHLFTITPLREPAHGREGSATFDEGRPRAESSEQTENLRYSTVRWDFPERSPLGRDSPVSLLRQLAEEIVVPVGRLLPGMARHEHTHSAPPLANAALSPNPLTGASADRQQSRHPSPARHKAEMPEEVELTGAEAEEARAPDDIGAAIDGVMAMFKLKIAALRLTVPRHKLAGAITALIEERQAAINAIKERKGRTVRRRKTIRQEQLGRSA